MPQNEYMELHKKRHGERFDTEERSRKRIAREGHKQSEFAQKVCGSVFVLSFVQHMN
jgi:ribosome biogenesis protein NSA2